MGIFRQLIMNMAVFVNPESRIASVRCAAAFGAGYLKSILNKDFFWVSCQIFLVKIALPFQKQLNKKFT